jgi:hypothetical protein
MAYNATLTVSAITARYSDLDPLVYGVETRHQEFRAKIRSSFQLWTGKVDQYLKYYRFANIVPAGASMSVQGDNVDVTDIAYNLVFTIEPSAWPRP